MRKKIEYTHTHTHVLALKLTSEDDHQIWIVPNSITSHPHSDRLKFKTDISIPCQLSYLPDPREGCDPDRERRKSAALGSREQKCSTVGTSGKSMSPFSVWLRKGSWRWRWPCLGFWGRKHIHSCSLSHTLVAPTLFLSR